MRIWEDFIQKGNNQKSKIFMTASIQKKRKKRLKSLLDKKGKNRMKEKGRVGK